MPKAAEVIDIKRQIVIQPGQCKLAVHSRNHWEIYAGEGVIPEDVDTDQFWALIASKVREYDVFSVLAHDGSWEVEGRILQCSKTWAKCFVKHTWIYGDTVDPVITDRFEVKFRGPEHRWCVIRKNDGSVMSDKLPTKEEANRSLVEYESKLG